MTETTSPRFGMVVWGAGTDTPTRVEFDGNFNDVETLAAILVKGTHTARLSLAVKERTLFLETDTNQIWLYDGTAWFFVVDLDNTVALNALAPRIPPGSDVLVSVGDTQTLTGKTLTDPIIAEIKVNGGANTVALPTTTDTLVGRATFDTLSHKILTGAVLDATSTIDGITGAQLAADDFTAQQAAAAWISSATTFTGLTLGNGTVVARYHEVGTTLDVVVELTLGSTSVVTGTLGLTLPGGLTTPNDGIERHLQGVIGNAAGGFVSVDVPFAPGAGSGSLSYVGSGNGNRYQAVNATHPATTEMANGLVWAQTGATVKIFGRIEI